MPPENISFNNESDFHFKSRTVLSQPESPAMIRLLVKHGLVKTESQAQALLMSVMALCLIVSIYVVYATFYKQPSLSNLSTQDQSAVKADLYIAK